MKQFWSDNQTEVAPEIMAALAAANRGAAKAYGEDAISGRLDALFSALFETEVAVFPVATGTAANALALSRLAPRFGAIFCHPEAHIHVDECGAAEFYTGGAKLIPVAGAHGRLDAEGLAQALREFRVGAVHQVQPAAVSLTQATERGTVYSLAELAAIAEVAAAHRLGVHMDGARFANAVVHLGCSPADASWRAGVDVLSFGATKNGAMAAEAVIFFKPGLARDFGFLRMRGGHLISKMRFVSAQLEAYLTDELWLRNAAHANAMAQRLARGLGAVPGAELAHPVDGNQLFVRLPGATIEALIADGFLFYRWPATVADSTVIRLVSAFDTGEADIAALVDAATRHGEAAA